PSGIAADSLGNLYVSVIGGTSRGQTIQKIAGAFTPPVTLPWLSTLQDNFNASTIDTAKWPPTGGASINTSQLQLGSAAGIPGYVDSHNAYRFDGALAKVSCPDGGNATLAVLSGSDYVKIV